MFRRLLVVAGTVLAVSSLGGPAVAGHGFESAKSSTSSSASSHAKAKAKLPSRATFGIGPTNGGVNGYFTYDSGPGGSYVDKAVITNYSHFPLALQVYVASIGNAADGSIEVGQQGRSQTDAATWLALPQGFRQVVVPASTAKRTGRVAVPFQLSVPSAAEPGDHAAAIVASLNTIGKNPKGENIKLEQRIAARVYVRVDGPLHPALQVQNLSVSYHGTLNPVGRGSAAVSYTVQNTGNVRLSVAQAVSVTGLFGTGAQADAPDLTLIFPGASVNVTARVQEVFPTVFENAHVTLKPRVVSDQKAVAMAAVSAAASFTAVPWMLLGILVLLLLAIVALFVLRRRRRRGSRRAGGAATSFGASSRRHGQGPARGGRGAGATSRAAGWILGPLAMLVAGLITMLGAGPAHADDAVPFADPSVKGYLGFCDSAGKQVTSGNLTDVPFAYRAVSSAPSPSGYTVGAGAKATLFAYQPIQGIDPGNWSGMALTGSAFFSNPAHPMAQATVLDYSLGSFVENTTVLWNRLVQLRVYISQPNKAVYTQTYPAAVVKVTGSTWQEVQGGSVDCTAGKTKPVEELALPASRFASASRSLAARASATASSHEATSPTSSSDTAASTGDNSTTPAANKTARGQSSSPPVSTDGTSGSGDGYRPPRSSGATTRSEGSQQASSSHSASTTSAASAGGGSAWPIVGAIAVVLLVVAGAAAWWLRRRPATG